ncbi:S-methyl-5-thioribose-1-phosphate isomerase [Actinospica durhamensis]|uniref:Methylthioribose-1-phosphate isomerase n=1 Tax=Actinospica durhamensis TaxID=1508375 RepID=A0A941IN87_9ACTN|nr:S-methyl-5-thioribose-1-phosphate isomerase [Actinospica durhamensis]MBR7833699.1 S-methyl-5-thioribose-1-phosphate isomerase [Actinospica durhamensis]
MAQDEDLTACPVRWADDGLLLIDQTRLPGELRRVLIDDVDALVEAIRSLAVRGAPALGVAGAFGVAVALRQGAREGWDRAATLAAVERIRHARPTAVNLRRGTDRAAARLEEGVAAVLEEAEAVRREDVAANRRLSELGADWLLARAGHDRPLRLLTHCNAGALATAGWGTALGVVRELHRRGRVELVYVDETRPLLQGARLTAWELAQEGIAHVVQVDGAAASTILYQGVDAAVVGADRIAANGDTANKIGTLGVALACAHAGIPFLVAAPTTTVDPDTPDGAAIPIELRAPHEVTGPDADERSPGFNPAFDVTPGSLVSALVTERGVAEVSRGELPGKLWGTPA